MPNPLAYAAVSGFLLAMAGTYWDDAWHTDRGRDSFLIPPHICLYVGIAVAGAALGLWALRLARADGIRSALGDPRVMLALVGLSVTLGAAPIDNAWHVAFGRDAVLWSPPHMLGVAGSLAIAAALLLALTPARSTGGRIAGRIAAVAVLAVAVIPVLEYETDVPQFDSAWYLPVLALGAAFALGVVKSILPGAWPAATAALLYTVLRVLITGGLLLAGMAAPIVPLLVVPAVILDATVAREHRRSSVALAFAVSLYAVYVPYLDWVKSDVFLDLADVVLGLPLAALASYVGLAIAGQPRADLQSRPTRPRRRRRGAAALAMLAALMAPASASAHDPGQGEEVAVAKLEARTEGSAASLAIDLTDVANCSSFRPTALIARRGGESVSAALQESSPCRFGGAIELPDRGRWFVYGELENGGQALETWLPVHAGQNEVVSGDRSIYVPAQNESGALKYALGVVVYGFLAAVIAAIAALTRRRTSPPPGARA
ncbi:MAG: hypothetical protein H0V25_00335 [Solirubrobacterales bacterium]|nr:hypothetical protein [Solirubrobacterales bacterium]